MVTAKRKAYLEAYRAANRERLAAEDRARYAANRDAALATRQKYRDSHKAEIAELKRAYRERNREALQAQDREYYYANRERITTQRQGYRVAHAASVAANNRARQASKVQRTPAWVTADDLWMMRQAYELARLRTKMFGFAWHVDHIYPLRGATVSGLHVPTNLQVIPATDNCRKSNRV